MSALPPLADHRLVVLRALDTLGARYSADGVTMGAIGYHADLDAGQVWLACSQLQHGGFIVATDSMTGAHPDLGGDNRRTWSLTEQGRTTTLYEDAEAEEVAGLAIATRAQLHEAIGEIAAVTRIELEMSGTGRLTIAKALAKMRAALGMAAGQPAVSPDVDLVSRKAVSDAVCLAVAEAIEENSAVSVAVIDALNSVPSSFADGGWKPVFTAPTDRDLLVFRHDGGAPWGYGIVELARRHVAEEGGDAGWWLADGSTPITDPLLWMPFERPAPLAGWRP